MRKMIFFLGVIIIGAAVFLCTAVDKPVAEGEQLQPAETSFFNEKNEDVPKIKTMESASAEEMSEWYAYSQLNEEEKGLYICILTGLQAMSEEFEVNTLDTELLDKVFSCVMSDHPEIFYVSGYRYTRYTEGDVLKRLTFQGEYIYDAEEIKLRQAQIDEAANKMLLGIDRNASDYSKVKYVYDTIISETEYDLYAEDNQNICSVFLNRKSVCQGYAKATQYLLGKLGINSCLVTGKVKNGEGHAWNLVQVDGKWYYLDTTWGDAYYRLQEGMLSEGESPSVNYDYFCVTTQQLANTHSMQNVVPMPDCVAMDANYFVVEGAYFTAMDRDKLAILFEKAYAEGREQVMIKCDSLSVYQELYEALIENQEVFSYLHNEEGTVSYTNNEEQRSLSFWL